MTTPAAATAAARAVPATELAKRYARVRARTEELAAGLSPEDQTLQSMPSASPTKWHRAHTTWFFETFVLAPSGVQPVDERYAVLFNSYYEGAGPRHARAKRGLLSRPSVDEIAAYRATVDERVVQLLRGASQEAIAKLEPTLHVGLAHEEQHQELLLTDILHAFSENPIHPAYRTAGAPTDDPRAEVEAMHFVLFEPQGGVQAIGAGDEVGFAFDNERPRHKRFVEPFALANRLVTVAEMKAFIREGGYRTPSLWLSDGWDFVRAHHVEAPLHARVGDGAYTVFGLDGERMARDDEPVAHVSYYEADAIARFLGARLPTEAEWELAASNVPVDGNFLDSGALRPRRPVARDGGVQQLFGDAWEWTQSSYEPYPGYRPFAGSLGEYNGKFMCNQMVLRGGSCFTPPGHVRASYRNFWPADTRFQMTGVRLARGR